MNAKTTLPHFISLTFSLRLLMYTLTTPEVLLVETFLSCKNTLQYGLRSICFNGAKIWNSVPSEIRDASSVRTFKTNLKNLFFDSYISQYVRRLLGMYSVWRRYLLAISALGGPWWSFPRLCAFCWGTRKMKESRLSLSWCSGVELGTEMGASVGLLGRGWWGMFLRWILS